MNKIRLSNSLSSKVLLLSGSLIFALLISEFTLRLLGESPQIVQLRRDHFHLQDLFYSKVFETSPQGNRLPASSTFRISGPSIREPKIEVRTNSLGIRALELDQLQERKVLLIGDSVTLALTIPQQQTISAITEMELNKAGLSYSVINSGVDGLNLKEELKRAKELLPVLKPEIIVFVFVSNDLQASESFSIYSPPFWLEQSWFAQLLFRGLSVEYGQRQRERLRRDRLDPSRERNFSNYWRNSKSPFIDWIQKHYQDIGEAWNPIAWQEHRFVFAELKALQEKTKIPFLFFPTPLQTQLEFPELDVPQQQLSSITKEFGLSYCNPLPALRDEHSLAQLEGFYVQDDPVHFNTKGHEHLGRKLASCIQSSILSQSSLK